MPRNGYFCEMTGIRSTVLAKHRAMTAPETTTVFTCPVGFTVIVKAAALSQWGATVGALYIDIHSAAGQPSLHLIAESPASGTTVFWEGWLVMQSGDYIVFAVNAAPADCWVSGAMLPDAISG
jgi:hypothetical protein